MLSTVAGPSAPRPGAGPLLAVRDVAVHYGEVVALAGADLAVAPGELVALAGENGAGKSTLVRCIAGELAPDRGRVLVAGRPVTTAPGSMARRGVAVVWQNLALCDNLDVASNLLLGREGSRLLMSETRFQARAAAHLDRLGIPLPDPGQLVASLSGGQRQLLAVARAMIDDPDLLILDEPTAALGVAESAQVEDLIVSLSRRGTTILLVSHDLDQMYRLAGRIVVLRHGRIVADVDPAQDHPDDVVAHITGQEVDASARAQLSRLHVLMDRLAAGDPSSGLPMILSALGTALGDEHLAIHVVDDGHLRLQGEIGLPPGLRAALDRVPLGADGGSVGLAGLGDQPVVAPDVRTGPGWSPWQRAASAGRLGAAFSVPVLGSGGTVGVLSVFRRQTGLPPRDELDLVTLYAGHAGAAMERERLLREVTARNRVLETIREMLESLAGPAPGSSGVAVAVDALRERLGAAELGLAASPGEAGDLRWLAVSAPGGEPAASPALVGLAEAGLASAGDERAGASGGGGEMTVAFTTPGGRAVLAARWDRPPADDACALLEDAANSLRLALEREEAERAAQETVALRRTQQLQRDFLSRLSHELRTPLTAIQGYASSLMQPDVTWDGPSQERFLGRIAGESARLGRLVEDLLDFSAMESSVFRLHPDWCELRLVLDAAVACIPPEMAGRVSVATPIGLPPVWADHDRLEQVFVNLIDNALRHNRPGTKVRVGAQLDGAAVALTVADDGDGVPADLLAGPIGAPRPRRGPTSGAGLGLSITRGIVAAHRGSISLDPTARGTCFRVRIPIEGPDHPSDGAEHRG